MKQQDHVPVIIGSLGRLAEITRLLIVAAGAGEPLLGEGRYEGEDEVCFMLQARLVSQPIWDLLADYDQDTVLLLDNQRSAYLLSVEVGRVGEVDNAGDYLGTWVQVDRLTALNSQNYSKFGENYYVVR